MNPSNGLPRGRRIVALLVLAALGTSCVLDHTPGIRACAPGLRRYFTTGPSDGTLRIVPSAVPGVEIDSAGWKTDAHIEEFGADVILVLAVRIRAERPVATDSLALIYRTDGSDRDRHARIADASLLQPIYTLTPAALSQMPQMVIIGDTARRHATAGAALRYERIVALGGGFITGPTAPINGCPATVQLVPRHALAFYLYPERFAAVAVQAMAKSVRRREPAQELSDGVVVWDSVISSGYIREILIGVVANTAETPLSDPVARLSIVRDMAADTNPMVHLSGSGIDTLEYSLGPIDPHGVAGFAGGALGYLELINDREVGSASAFRERPLATTAEQNRVSVVRWHMKH